MKPEEFEKYMAGLKAQDAEHQREMVEINGLMDRQRNYVKFLQSENERLAKHVRKLKRQISKLEKATK